MGFEGAGARTDEGIGIPATDGGTEIPVVDGGATDSRPLEIDRALVLNPASGDGSHRERVRGRGHPDLTFDSERSAVCRTSDYVDDRTVMVDADRAAAGLDRDLVAALADGAVCEFTVSVV